MQKSPPGTQPEYALHRMAKRPVMQCGQTELSLNVEKTHEGIL